MDYFSFCFFLAVILTIAFLFKTNSTHNVDITLFFIFGTVGTFGFWQRSTSTALEQAILSQQICYIGGCFATLSLLFSILRLCKIHTNKYLRLVLMISSAVIFTGSLTIGKSDIFYKSCGMVFENGKHVFVKEYGILHYVFYGMLIFNYMLSFLLLIHGIRRKKEVSIKTVTMILLIMALGLLAYFGSKTIFNYELIPAWYVLSNIVFFTIDDKLLLYDIDKTVIYSLINKDTIGVVSFDRNYRFLGCNNCAKNIYPPLRHLSVDRKVDHTNPELNELDSWINFFKRNIKSEFYYKRNDNYFKVVSKDLYVENKIRGYQLVFTDCTEEKLRESKLIKISITDELTKLFNRRAFEEEIEKIQSDGVPEDFTIISFDLNGLKRANDTKGHAAGDELIIASATCLNQCLEPYGYVYRTGGDEYIAIVICSKEELENTFKAIEDSSKAWEGEYTKGLSISKGAASITEFPDFTIEQLEKEAESRMYKDKTRFYIESGIERRRG